MGEIIAKSRAGVQQQLSDEEFRVAVASWTEVLEGHVPETRLNDCYVRATRFRTSTFPIAPSELCTAWNELQQAERYSTPHAEMSRQLKGEICQACWGTGYQVIRRGKYNYSMPCYHEEAVY